MADGVEEAPILRDHSGRIGQLAALRSPIRAAGIRGQGLLGDSAPRARAAIVRPMARIVTYAHRYKPPPRNKVKAAANRPDNCEGADDATASDRHGVTEI
jgi:hypothetical protein